MIWFFLVVFGALAALVGLYWRWSRRIAAELAEGAAVEWAQIKASDPEFLDGIERARFDEIHRRVNFPRFPGYALATLAAFALSLPATFGLLAGGLLIAERAGWTSETYEVANRFFVDGDQMRIVTAAPSEAALYYVRDLAGFYYFFGLIFVWLLIVAFFMRRYHQRRPGYLRDEIIRAR